MPVPLPTEAEVDLDPPSFAETRLTAAGIVAAARPPGGPTEVQRLLVESTVEALTGHRVATRDLPDLDPHGLALHLARRNLAFRTRIVHMMVLGALVLRPVPAEVAASVAAYSRELGVDDDLLRTVAQFSAADRALAAVDFERNGYTRDWSDERSAALHTSGALRAGWDASVDDPALAARWHALGDLPEGTLGQQVHRFYRARGFEVPGAPGSAPPLLAQHDWVHVLADHGSTVEAELEVFALIARANDDPRGFSLLAMVVGLFETGYLSAGAGLFEAFPGQLSRPGMTVRVGDAMRRGALSHGLDGTTPDVDLMQVDWFSLADRPVEELRRRFGLVEVAAAARAAGSCGPFSPGGISAAQDAAGRAAAERRGEAYDAFGASVA